MVEVCDFDPIFSEFVIRFQLVLVNYALQMLDLLHRSCKLRRSEFLCLQKCLIYYISFLDCLSL